MGFFKQSQISKGTTNPGVPVPLCGACGLYKECNTPKQSPGGKGNRRILIIGAAPGKEDDRNGTYMQSPGGKYMAKIMRGLGVSLLDDCWVTNALICKGKPTAKRIAQCRPNIANTIKELEPDVVILLGGHAVNSLLPFIWKGDKEVASVGMWKGWQIPSQQINAWVCPVEDPGDLVRASETGDPTAPVQWLQFEKQLAAALALEGKPWQVPPDYTKEVKVLWEPDEINAALYGVISKGGFTAFDYEGNTLKPDNTDVADIVSCSVCWRGVRTFAFPYTDAVRAAWVAYLRSPVPKSASNMKHEQRHSVGYFGTRVRGWYWDTVLGAHWLDNRTGITGLKFQSFVLLGAPAYDDHITFTSENCNSDNGIRRHNEIGDLLLYNGVDSILEYHVAIKQMEAGGYPLPERFV